MTFQLPAGVEQVTGSNAHYRIFDISYSPGFAAEVADAFPRCAEAINAGKAVPLSKNPQSLNVAMRECIHSVLKCKFNDASRALYLDAKVREYLVLALHN